MIYCCRLEGYEALILRAEKIADPIHRTEFDFFY
jgi:hypothetical protein